MNPSLPSSAVARPNTQDSAPLSLPAAFGEQLSSLYGLVQRSSFVFGSPLGPFWVSGRTFQVPRFVYFGPHMSEAGVRLAFLAGFDHRDLRPTLSLLHFVEGLALKPDIGQGLSLSIFPLVDVVGLAGLRASHTLSDEGWVGSQIPEIRLLEKEARTSAFHGFVRIESAPGLDVVGVSLRGALTTENISPDVELISSEDVRPFEVRWEADPSPDRSGPLAIADDTALRPFELVLRVPASWPLELYREATAAILKRFVIRYRGFFAYGQHL